MNQESQDRSITRLEKIDSICNRFERAVREGQTLRIEDLLAEVPAGEQPELLKALVGVEIEMAAPDSPPDLNAYLDRFPDQQAPIRGAFRTARQHDSHGTQDSGDKGTITVHDPIADTIHTGGGDSSHHPEAEPVPQQIGRFEIVGVLGQGAFGRVYRARDPKLSREVALKVPTQGLGMTENAVRRFVREGRAAANLRHTNICPVFELGDEAQQQFITMAFIEGETLAEKMKSSTFSEAEAVQLVRKLAAALEYAHSKGVIHRDLKPGNIMFDAEHGEPVIMDFGLAHFAEPGESMLTQAGMVMGTPTHMSPEQARGNTEDISPISDVYSLGVIFYELLCGRLPFTGSIAEVLGKILHVIPEPPSAWREGIDPQLEAICLRAMAKSPTDRYPSMQDLVEALDNWHQSASVAEQETISLPTDCVDVRSKKKRVWLAAGVVATVAALVLVTGAFSGWWSNNTEAFNTAESDGTSSSDDVDGTKQVTADQISDGDSTAEPIEVTKFDVLASREGQGFMSVGQLQSLQPGDSVHFSVELSAPAHVRLLWIDAKGVVQELYPQDPELGHRGASPVSSFESPVQVDRGWPLEPTGGSELAMLIVSREPFDDSPFPSQAWQVDKDMAFTQVTRYSASRERQAKQEQTSGQTRSLGHSSQQVDDPVLQLLEQLRKQSDVVHVIGIPTVTESGAARETHPNNSQPAREP